MSGPLKARAAKNNTLPLPIEKAKNHAKEQAACLLLPRPETSYSHWKSHHLMLNCMPQGVGLCVLRLR